MNNPKSLDSEKAQRLNQLLEDLKREGNLAGILFSYREGNLITENIGKEFNSEEFSSMCASVLESAIGLNKTMNDKKLVKIIAELEKQTIIIVECDEKTFLALILNEESKVNSILENIEKYIRKIIFFY